MKKIRLKNPRGFTLIEMLVSITLFAVVMTMALGALLALSVADRRAEASKSAMDNLTFATDSMTRSLRTGSSYHCGTTGTLSLQQDCASGDNYITFLTATGGRLYYQLDTSNAHCGPAYTNCIERSTDNINWFPITSPDISINATGHLFYMLGTSPFIQPTVIITISGTLQLSSTLTQTFQMQTSVTQRIYDL